MFSKQPVVKQPTFWLSLAYLATGLAVAYRITLIIVRKYRWFSYNFAFLILCLVSCLIRSANFMFWYWWFDKSRKGIALAIFWLPVNIQFATFSLLAVFYASVVNASRWKSIKIPVWCVYAALNILFLAAYIASVLVEKQKLRDKARTGITASIFIILVGVLGYYGFKVWRILLHSSNPDPKLHGISPMRLAIGTGQIMVIYLTRALYAIVSDIVPSYSLYFGVAGENLINEIFSCLYYIVWEIVPTVIILILFWETTPPAKRAYNPLHSIPFLADGYSSINGDVEEGESEDDFGVITPRYLSSNTITYSTGSKKFDRESTSLFPQHGTSPDLVGSYNPAASFH